MSSVLGEEGGGGGRCGTLAQLVSCQRSPVNMRRQWLRGVETTHMEEEEEEEGRRILSGMQGRMSPPTGCVADSHPHSGNRDTAEVEGIDQLQVL